MIPITLPRATGIRPGYFTALTVMLGVAASAYVVTTVRDWIDLLDDHPAGLQFSMPSLPDFLSLPDLSSARFDNDALHVTIGGYPFRIPEDMIASSGMRNEGATADHIQLNVSWPGMTPHVTRNARRGRMDDDAIQIEIDRQPDAEGMSERLDTIYRPLSRGLESDGPQGLKTLRLSLPEEEEKDLIFYAPEDQPNGFVARCLVPRDEATTGTCSRTVRLKKDLLLTYRFRQLMLADWQQLERKTLELVRSLR